MASPLDFIERQFEALPPGAPVPTEGEGLEESAAVVSLDETLARAERHEAEALRAAPSPQATYEQTFIQLIDGLKLPNISGAEIVAPHKRVAANGAKNTLPPPWAAFRLACCLIYDQMVRHAAGAPLRFNSLYRAPDYNKAIGGASRSQHRVGTARDRVLIGQPVSLLADIDKNLRHKRVAFTAEQKRALDTFARLHHLSEPFADSVLGEPFDARAVRYVGPPEDPHATDAGFNVLGGRGTYAGFCHQDVRGQDVAWRG